MRKINLVLLSLFSAMICCGAADPATAATAAEKETEEQKAAALLRKQKIRVREVMPVAVARIAAFDKRGGIIGIIGNYKGFTKDISAEISAVYGEDRYVEIKMDGHADDALPIIMETRANTPLIERLVHLKEGDRMVAVGRIKIVRLRGKDSKESIKHPVFELESFLQLPPLPVEKTDDAAAAEPAANEAGQKTEPEKTAKESDTQKTEPEKTAKEPAAEQTPATEEDEWI